MSAATNPRKLKLYIKQVRGIAFKPHEISDVRFDGSVPVLKANNLTDDGLDDSSLIFIDAKKIKDEQLIRAGDILLAASSGSKKIIGKNVYFPCDYNGSFGAFCKLVRAKSGLLPEYLKHFFQTRYYRNFIEKSVQGANINNLKNEHLDEMEFLLPALDDQIRIAHLLSKVEGLVDQRKQHLQQLDNLLKSVFLELFGDPVRNEKGWNTLQFHKIGQFISGGTPSKSRADFWEGSFPWVSPKDMKVSKIEDAEDHISESVFEDTTLKRIGPNHLLIVVRGMILAHSFPVAINTVEVAINQDMKAIKPIKRLNVVYLQHCLNSLKRKILTLISTAGHGTRRFDSVAMQKLFIPNPPPELQGQFAAVAEKVEDIKTRYQQSLTGLENLYGALSQKAFKGELDLSRVVLPTAKEEPTEEQHAVPSVVVELPPTIELPAPDHLKSLLTAEGRKVVIEQWLDSYLRQLGSSVFSAASFMEHAQQRLWELMDDETSKQPELGVAEYDQLKQWLFNAIEQGTISQERNVVSSAGEKVVYGKQIIIKRSN